MNAVNAEELLKAGQLDEALASLHEQIRKAPADSRLRIFLFQLLSVLGRWDKALTQLQVLRDMDAESMLLAQIFTPVLQAEIVRAEVFAGARGPTIFGEPVEWISLLVQANQLVAQGKSDAVRALQQQALEQAPASAGKINGQPFEWIADADSRLGPLLEIILEGGYYWAPFFRIKSIQIEPPSDLRDMVWMPARFTWTNGGEATGFIPTRYASTESSADNALKLARKTEWDDKGDEFFLGRGQRLLATDQAEFPLLEIRAVEFANADAESTETATTPAG